MASGLQKIIEQCIFDECEKHIAKYENKPSTISLARYMLRVTASGKDAHRSTLYKLPQLFAATRYLIDNDYWRLVGGTFKPRVRFAVTGKGRQYLGI